MQIIVMAKAPVAGRVKTRLCPPCTPEEAAILAEAALIDTLTAALCSSFDRVVLALDGAPGPWLPAGVEVVAQRGEGFRERLATAWTEIGGPAVQIGMDTPQVTPALLDQARLLLPGAGSGRRARTAGRRRLVGARAAPSPPGGVSRRADEHARHRRPAGGPPRGAGPAHADVARLRDVDTIEDAVEVAAGAPDTHFAVPAARSVLAVPPA